MHNKSAVFALALLMLFVLYSCNNGGGYMANESGLSDEAKGGDTNQSVYIDNQPAVTPLFWSVTSENGSTLWLLGATFAADNSFYPLPEEVMSAYNSSSTVAVEFDKSDIYNIVASPDVSKYIYYTNSDTLRDNISDSLYNATMQILNGQNMYTPACEKMIPAYINTIVNQTAYEQAGLSDSFGTDIYFINAAKRDGKTLAEIEPPEQKYSIFASLSDELQETMLATTVSGYNNGSLVTDLKTAADAWKRGDEELLARMLIPNQDKLVGVYYEYYCRMYVERNQKMADFCISSLSENEDVFVCVGLSNLLGTDGVIAKLSSAGYSVEKVYYNN